MRNETAQFLTGHPVDANQYLQLNQAYDEVAAEWRKLAMYFDSGVAGETQEKIIKQAHEIEQLRGDLDDYKRALDKIRYELDGGEEGEIERRRFSTSRSVKTLITEKQLEESMKGRSTWKDWAIPKPDHLFAADMLRHLAEKYDAPACAHLKVKVLHNSPDGWMTWYGLAYRTRKSIRRNVEL